MKNICDWNNCKEEGLYKAPKERDNSKDYRLLCLKHVKEFNKNWNYFTGMSDQQILDFLRSDMTWHKPTQSFSSSDNFFKVLWSNALKDEMDKFKFNNDFNNMNKFNKIKEELRDKYKNNLVINFSPATSFRARCEFSYQKNQYVMHKLNKKIYINKFNDAGLGSLICIFLRPELGESLEQMEWFGKVVIPLVRGI